MSGRTAAQKSLAVAIVLATLPLTCAQAEPRKPTAKEVSAIRYCAAKYQDNLDQVEQECLFKLVADPCTNTPEGSSNVGTADCFRLETAIWDNLLNENFKSLLDTLEDQQIVKLRAMQRAWIAYRDTTCNFYWDKIQGTMAIPMSAACNARETAPATVFQSIIVRPLTAALAEPPIIFQHRIEQDLCASATMLLAGPLRFIVRNAAAAWHKNHRRRCDAGDIDGVMSGARNDVAG
jgi:uncharacterized protein YecT (DUF1311 family)